MSSNLKLLPVLFIALLLVCSTEAQADPLVITGGSITQTPASTPRFNFVGDGFSFTSRGSNLGGPHVSCGTCLVGGPVNVHYTITGLDFGFGSGTINGVFYPSLYFRGIIDIDANGIIGPHLDPLTRYVTVTAPFTLSGTYSATTIHPDNNCSGCPPLTPVFSVTLSGQGIATIRLLDDSLFSSTHPYSFDSATYTFQSQPVPEPTTLILLGTGLAGVALKKRKRRSS